jgi:hypothetical protein
MSHCDHRRRPRRPGLIRRAVYWRVELASATVGGSLIHYTGPVVVELLAATTGLVIATFPPAREVAVRCFHLVALPHRVRTALAQAGAVDLDGRLPWVLWARSAGPNAVWVEVKLRPGVTYSAVCRAIPHIEIACVSPEVFAFRHTLRSDRVRVFLIRPRWGLLR